MLTYIRIMNHLIAEILTKWMHSGQALDHYSLSYCTDSVPAKRHCWRISHGLTCWTSCSIRTSAMATTALLQATLEPTMLPFSTPKKASNYGPHTIYPRQALYRPNRSRL